MSDSQQLLTALATEHFTLQGARSHLPGHDDGAGVFEYMGIPPEGRRRPIGHARGGGSADVLHAGPLSPDQIAGATKA
jgi:hypothetical protein